MPQVRVGTKDILGGTYEVYADDSGNFWIKESVLIDADDERPREIIIGSGESLKSAVAKARTELKKRQVKVSIPFIFADGRKGTAYGIHARNGQTMVEFEDGKKDSFTSGGLRSGAFKPDTPPEKIARLNEITTQQEQLSRERRQIEMQYAMSDLDRQVRRAIEQAAAAATEAA